MGRFYHNAASVLGLTALLVCVLGQSLRAQVDGAQSSAAKVQGMVRDSGNQPIAGAAVCLRAEDKQTLTGHTDSAGAYVFPAVHQGKYTLRAEMPGYDDATSSPFVLRSKESKSIDLALNARKVGATKNSSRAQPEFFDEPHFTVAGVADATNLGGHGSDVVVRNREAVARATVSLSKQPQSSPGCDLASAATEKVLREDAARQPENFEVNRHLGKFLLEEAKAQEALPYLERASRLNPGDFDNACELALAYSGAGDYAHARANARTLLDTESKSDREKADLYHLLGDVNERLGDPLEAVRAYQHAAELNPSERNLFDWGAELLTHHAAEPSVEVFTKGNRLFPRSARILAGLGAAWYSLGSYEQAAQRFCQASDLNPDDPNPYLLMGKMQSAETTESPAIVERLGRFARLEPQNALANYYYAVGLWKNRKSPQDMEHQEEVQSLLQKAVHLDPKLGVGYLELGIVYSEQKDSPKAISALQQAIDASPLLEQAHYRLAQLYRQAGESSQAHAELQVYEKISAEKAQETDRQRHEVQQFVYQLRDGMPASQSQ